MIFIYKARLQDGKVINAQIEADTLAQARDNLRKRPLTLLNLEPAKTGVNADIKLPFLKDRPPGLKQVALFSKQMATLINAGVPLVQALNIMQRQLESKAFQDLLRKIRADVEAGIPLSEAIVKYPRTFNRLYINLIRAGETSGTLDTIMLRISDFQEKELALRGKLKSALTYPVIVLVFALGVTFFLLTTIVPQFAGILTQLGAPLPPLTLVLIAVSNFLQHQTLILVIAIGLIYYAFKRVYATPKGRMKIDEIKLKLPVLGTLLRRAAIASFSRTFGLLLASGVNIIESLEITKGTADNAVIEESIENARNVVMVGEQMSSSMAGSKIFPPMVVSMISIGEETGGLDVMLNKVADFYEREVDEAVDGLTAAIEPIMIVFLGLIVGLIVAGMFLPMFAIIGQLSK